MRARIEAAVVVEGLGGVDGVKVDGEEAAVARLREVGRRGCLIGVVDGFAREERRVEDARDGGAGLRGVVLEEGRHGLGVAVEDLRPGEELARVGEEDLCVGGKELVSVLPRPEGREFRVMGGEGVEDDRTAHNVG